MDEANFLQEWLARVSGPMKFRLVMQPLMAIIFAIRDGRKDAQAGRAPYLWSVVNQPEERRELLRSGWKSVGKIFIIATILDVVYQWKMLRAFHLVEALVVAMFLALIPYLIVRGPANRLLRRKGSAKPASKK
jgi:uncharacterized membrane protein YczE